MEPFLAAIINKIWNFLNIRGIILLGLFLQSFLLLFAPLRKCIGGKWGQFGRLLIWLAYLLKDCVATLSLGLILRSEISVIKFFWAALSLLHLGGPDTITSFSLEDNQLWIRHFLGLLLHVALAICFLLMTLSFNKFWLPTLLVLIVGIIKFAERIRALYLASFDHIRDTWVNSPKNENNLAGKKQLTLPARSLTLTLNHVSMFDVFKNALVDPPMSASQQDDFRSLLFSSNSDVALQTVEGAQSLLFEVLHTKSPVVDSKIGYVCRIISSICILGALLSFSLLEKHSKLEEFDIWLTYGLLIGAGALDFISNIFLIFSDWMDTALFKFMPPKSIKKRRRRWSNSVSQLNFFTYLVKDDSVWLKLAGYLGMGSLYESIRRSISVSSKNFRHDLEWRLLFEEVRGKCDSKIISKGTRHDKFVRILQGNSNLDWSINNYKYVESLLIWHIATEICYQRGDRVNRPSSSSKSRRIDHREICKSLSDYMFYLLVMEPTMMASVLDNWNTVFEQTSNEAKKISSSISDRMYFSTKDVISRLDGSGSIAGKLAEMPKQQKSRFFILPLNGSNSLLPAASALAKMLRRRKGGCPWELMGKVWVELLCYAAINCKPTVHAEQVSKGGQLLTLVWLLMNFMGLTSPGKEW